MGKPDCKNSDLEQNIQEDIRKIEDVLHTIDNYEQKMSLYKANIKKIIKKSAISLFSFAAVACFSVGIMVLDEKAVANIEQEYSSRISIVEQMISNKDYVPANYSLDSMLIELSTSRVPSRIELTNKIQEIHENIGPIIEKQLEKYVNEFEDIKKAVIIDRIKADSMMREIKSSLIKENSQEANIIYAEISEYDEQVLHPWLEDSYSILYKELDAKYSSSKLEQLVGVYEESLSLLKNVKQSESSLYKDVNELSGRIEFKLSALKVRMNAYQTLFYKWQKTAEEDYAASILLRTQLQVKLESETEMDVSYMLNSCKREALLK